MINQISIIEKERLITAKEVQTLTGIRSRVTLWRKSNDDGDAFPQAFRNGSHFTRWKLSEILEWMDGLRMKPDNLA